MSDPADRSAVRWIRWIPRILGIPIGFITFGQFLTSLGYIGDLKTVGYVMNAGLVLVFAGCIVGWLKELPGALLILGGSAIFGVMTAVHHQALWVFLVMISPAVVGILFLCVHLAGKREKPGREVRTI